MKLDSVLGLPELQEVESQEIEAARHIAIARHSLTCVCDKVGGRHKWPELDKALTELEIALGILTTETGGML